MDKPVSFIVPSRDNLRYLKWSYNSIRKHCGYRHEICIASDFCKDGTPEWCVEISKKDVNFKYIINNGTWFGENKNSPNRMGLTLLYDKLINEVATSDIFLIWHADMHVTPNMIVNMQKHLIKESVITATRMEPPLHPEGAEKLVVDFGLEPENFKEYEFLEFVAKQEKENKDKITEGFFAPWMMYKKDFLSIGGHDPLFAPTSREDSDIGNRFMLAGYKLIQPRDAFVYHLTSRGSRFRDGIHKNSDEWIYSNQKNMRNFIRKWGTGVQHDQYLKPIVSPKYDIGFVVYNCDLNIAYQLEVWCNTLYSDLSKEESDIYIKTNQVGTLYDLDKRLRSIDEEPTNDIIVKFDASKLTNENFQYLVRLNEIIIDSGEVGSFTLDIFDIEIKKIKDYKMDLIIADNSGKLR